MQFYSIKVMVISRTVTSLGMGRRGSRHWNNNVNKVITNSQTTVVVQRDEEVRRREEVKRAEKEREILENERRETDEKQAREREIRAKERARQIEEER